MPHLIPTRRVTGMSTNPTVALNRRLARQRRRRADREAEDRATKRLRDTKNKPTP